MKQKLMVQAYSTKIEEKGKRILHRGVQRWTTRATKWQSVGGTTTTKLVRRWWWTLLLDECSRGRRTKNVTARWRTMQCEL